MKAVMAALLSLVLGTAAVASETVAKPTLIVRFSVGGNLLEFIEKYNKIDELQGRVVIDGVCISACTVVLGLVDLSRVCATERGAFAFHSATVEGKFSVDGTNIAWWIYPTQVRGYLESHGFHPEQSHEELLFVKATQFVQPCAASVATTD